MTRRCSSSGLPGLRALNKPALFVKSFSNASLISPAASRANALLLPTNFQGLTSSSKRAATGSFVFNSLIWALASAAPFSAWICSDNAAFAV